MDSHHKEEYEPVDRDLHRHKEQQLPKSSPKIIDDRPRRTRSAKEMKRSSRANQNTELKSTGPSGNNNEGRHYHLDLNTVPFILGASTTPSHNVKSNVQNVRGAERNNQENNEFYARFSIKVIALLKTHNHQLCLSSKQYAELVHPHLPGDPSAHKLLYLDHYHKSSDRPTSASHIRSMRRSRSHSLRRTHSVARHPRTSLLSDKQCYSRVKRLRQEFTTLAHEQTRLSTSRTGAREAEIVTRRMEMILDELERLFESSMRKSSSKDQHEQSDTPLETLRKTKLIQHLLRDPQAKQRSRELS